MAEISGDVLVIKDIQIGNLDVETMEKITEHIKFEKRDLGSTVKILDSIHDICKLKGRI